MLVHSHKVSSLNLPNSSGIGSGGVLFIISIGDSDGMLSKEIQPNMRPMKRPQIQQTECWWRELFLLHATVKDMSMKYILLKLLEVADKGTFVSKFRTRYEYFFGNYCCIKNRRQEVNGCTVKTRCINLQLFPSCSCIYHFNCQAKGHLLKSPLK